MNILTSKVEASRANEVDASNIQFGKSYSDHMLVADYIDGVWQTPEIIPYGNISISPATTFIHYGQAIFEGVKAYRNINGEIAIFRPKDNNKRFNISAERLAMPHVPEEIFVQGMKELVARQRLGT